MAPVLGYWSLRGLAQHIRYVLHYTGTEYEEKQYNAGPGPEYSKQEWLDDRDSLGLEFPNLPYYIDGDLKITESTAILRHLARKHGLYGSTEEDRIRVDVACGITHDVTFRFIRLCYDDKFEKLKDAYIADISGPVGKLAKLVADNRTYVLGDKISLADFLLFETIERFVAFMPTCLASFEHLSAFQARIADLPAIKTYRSSPEFQKIRTRFTGRSAKWGAGEY
uniref:glutathione transferase n=1 Tax=Hirondellea gigas TaxID=1518452 RepID=A0A2P2HXY9_9CRUS